MSFFKAIGDVVGGVVEFFSGSDVSNVVQGVGAVAGAVGAATAFSGAEDAADALSRQAGQIEELGEEEARFVIEQAELEADLIAADGSDQAAVLAFNQRVALDNAAWERRAGGVAFNQSRKRWEHQIKDTVAQFAASGARLTGTTNDVILEQISEMEEDLFNVGLNAERAALREDSQADFFSLRHDQVLHSAQRRSEGRRAIGLLEAGATETAAGARAQAARTQSRTAEITGTADLFKSGSSLLSGIADFTK